MENTTVENTTVTKLIDQETFIELAAKWIEEYGNLRLKDFFTSDDETTPLVQHKRYLVSKTISDFLRSNGIYPGAMAVFTLMFAVDEPLAYAEKCPIFDTEELEEDIFDYSTVYGDDETEDCECFSRL